MALAQAGADINTINTEGRTPLITAVYNNDGGNSMLLASLGADLNIKDSTGMTAYEIAMRHNNAVLADFLHRTAELKKEDTAVAAVTGYEFDI